MVNRHHVTEPRIALTQIDAVQRSREVMFNRHSSFFHMPYRPSPSGRRRDACPRQRPQTDDECPQIRGGARLRIDQAIRLTGIHSRVRASTWTALSRAVTRVRIPSGLLVQSAPTLCAPRDEELTHLGAVFHLIDSMLRGSLSVHVSRETPLPPLTLVSQGPGAGISSTVPTVGSNVGLAEHHRRDAASRRLTL
jgi:arginine deiminase